MELSGDTRPKRNGLSLLTKLINDKSIQVVFRDQIYIENNIVNLSFAILAIKDINESFFLDLTKGLRISYLAEKIDSERKFFRLPLFLLNMKNIDMNIIREILRNINLEIIAELLTDEDMFIITSVLMAVYNIDQEIAMKFVNYLINKKSISGLLDELFELDLWTESMFIFYIASGNKQAGKEIASRINVNALIDKIETSSDLTAFMTFLKTVNILLNEIKNEVMNDIDLDNFRERSMRILNENDALYNGLFISTVAIIDRIMANRLIGEEYLDQFEKVIERSKGLDKIAFFIMWLAYANREMAIRVINKIKNEIFLRVIEREAEFGHISNFIMIMAYVDKNVAFKWYVYAVAYSQFDLSIQLIKHININDITKNMDIDDYLDMLLYDLNFMFKISYILERSMLEQLKGDWTLKFHKNSCE